MTPEFTSRDLAAALDRTADEIFARAGVDPQLSAPNMFDLARGLGLAVAIDRAQSGRGRFVRLSPPRGAAQGSILLRPEPRPERAQWALAHELGEQAAFRVFEHLGVAAGEAGSGAREQTANLLAGRLLLPTSSFAPLARESGWDLVALKKHFRTASHELIARRMLDFEPRVIVSIVDQTRATFRRGNFTTNVPPMSAAETNCWRFAHERGKDLRRQEGRIEIQAWAVHEVEWKREIIRVCYDGLAFD